MLVSSCANSPQAPIKKSPVNQKLIPAPIKLSASEEFIKLAEQAKLAQNTAAVINNLLMASEALVFQLSDALNTQHNSQQALWLAEQLNELITTANDKYRLALVKAQSLINLQQFELAYTQLDIADELAQKHNLRHNINYYHALTIALSEKGLKVASLQAKLQAFALNTQSSTTDINDIWQSLTQLSQWQIEQLKKSSFPYKHGWIALIIYANKYGNETQKFNRFLINWRRQYPNHPANSIIEEFQQNIRDLQPPQVSNVAILLPLTGKQQRAGIASQQGILAAYKDQENLQLFFIDTNKLDWQNLATQFSEQNIDHVIGPLLKSNVTNYINNEALNLPTLFLNVPQNNVLAATQFAVSMRPEDEAIQAASSLCKRNFQHPLVISDSDVVSKRISASFAEQWLKQRGTLPEIFYLPGDKKNPATGKQRQKSLQASLDVGFSHSRIKHIKSRVKRKTKTQERNRRDIDMIYLVTNSQKTRLLKPYIDVSVSPFADLIPIFASSRSHSSKIDRQSTQDLNSLTFTEIPWLLNSKQQNQALSEKSQQLWPQRNDSLQRIFALGFDSLSLITKIPLMQQAPYIHHFGQTGTLKYNDDHILTRSLLWGTYQRNKVTAIDMD